MEIDNPDLVRYWFVFDLADHRPPPLEPGEVRVDGGTRLYRILERGAGVTGYDEQDCLRLLEDAAGEPLPPLELPALRNPPIDPNWHGPLGNPAWRGVWYPVVNTSGPVIGPASAPR
ncbi:hypothetical protein [Catellatospora citrea]|uniref:Uncharacterized protein n=1 Tax=Catellatospora citrea TaxID=53366 RepID=A0A8J3KNU7_9ACTN|nr:hypothetical protein [Catellatospora citrea]RKE12008.1 hypothetical protein C8E86_6942 [Catellatospora citrea]GIG00441.1 hypothetical protein Cci01nite_55340 [Catellatospora citrea]